MHLVLLCIREASSSPSSVRRVERDNNKKCKSAPSGSECILQIVLARHLLQARRRRLALLVRCSSRHLKRSIRHLASSLLPFAALAIPGFTCALRCAAVWASLASHRLPLGLQQPALRAPFAHLAGRSALCLFIVHRPIRRLSRRLSAHRRRRTCSRQPETSRRRSPRKVSRYAPTLRALPMHYSRCALECCCL